MYGGDTKYFSGRNTIKEHNKYKSGFLIIIPNSFSKFLTFGKWI